MSRESENASSGGRNPSGWRSLWRRLRPGGKGIRARREVGGDRWTWFGEDAPRKRARVRRFLLIGEIAAGVAVVLAGALFVILRTGDAGGPDPLRTTTSVERTPEPSPPGQTDAPTPPIPSSPATLATAIRIAAWDSVNRVWETDDLPVPRPAGVEGRSIAFMLNMENAVIGQTYNVELTYECRSGGTPGLEYLTDFDGDAGDLPISAPPGPQRPFPDAEVVLPDDPTTGGDDQTRSLLIWGAIPESIPTGPAPATECTSEKSVLLRVRALSENVHILWGAHLAPAAVATGDAASAIPLSMRVAVEGAGQSPAELSIIVPG
jgi:hypothetical protein